MSRLPPLLAVLILAAAATSVPVPAAAQESPPGPRILGVIADFSTTGGRWRHYGLQDMVVVANDQRGGPDIELRQCDGTAGAAAVEACFRDITADGQPLAVVVGSAAAAMTLAAPAEAAQIPIMAPAGGGPALARIGERFAWVFTPPGGADAEAQSALRFVATQVQGLLALRHEVLAVLYPAEDPAAGALEGLDEATADALVALGRLPVGPGGDAEPAAAWARLRQEWDARWVLIQGPPGFARAALAAGLEAGHAPERIILGAEAVAGLAPEEMPPASIGVHGLAYSQAGKVLTAHRRIEERLDPRPDGPTDKALFGTPSYNAGMSAVAFVLAAMDAAEERYATDRLTPELMRWGLENLRLEKADIARSDWVGLVPAVRLTCRDHAGAAGPFVLRWTGNAWTLITDAIDADQTAGRRALAKRAGAVAEGLGLSGRSCR